MSELSINNDGKIEHTIFKIYPDYHDLEHDKKEEILSALIQWACMEIYKIKKNDDGIGD
jgi:hypothetical protein